MRSITPTLCSYVEEMTITFPNMTFRQLVEKAIALETVRSQGHQFRGRPSYDEAHLSELQAGLRNLSMAVGNLQYHPSHKGEQVDTRDYRKKSGSHQNNRRDNRRDNRRHESTERRDDPRSGSADKGHGESEANGKPRMKPQETVGRPICSSW